MRSSTIAMRMDDQDGKGAQSSFKITGDLNKIEPISDHQDREIAALNKDKVQRAQLYTAVKTPYTKTGRLDLSAFDELVKF